LFNYGRITPNDLDENDKRFKKQWDANQPFEALVEQIDDAMDFASAGQAPYTPAQIVSNAYNLVFNTGLYPEACREWRRRPQATQTWNNFVIDFGMVHTDLRNQRGTSQQQGYQQANNMMEIFAAETADAFANLATAAAADKAIVQQLMTTNSDLMKQLAAKETEILCLRAIIDKSKKPGGNNGRPGTGTTNTTTKKRFDNDNYCWTHGFDCHPSHTSTTCKWPKEGHESAATKDNIMGGNQDNKGKKY
jgi:hypothetical protein